MSARLTGSASLHGRRRRRLAADDGQPSDVPADVAADGEGKPLPARRPTGRFPLRRVVSRSAWKLTAVGVVALAACGAAVASGYVPPIRSGAYGPGLAMLCRAETGRLPTSLGGLLLLATGQLAWLIRWARARSLRDFRGGYRIWWWTALAFAVCGAAVLTDFPAAFASTVVWLSGRTVLGSDLAYRFLPALAALVLLLPGLQRDMRGCRASRLLLFTAVFFWTVGGAATVAGDHVAMAIARLGATIPAPAVPVGLLLAGTVAAFSAMLFHTRHVVYESVEPPDPPARREKPALAESVENSETKEKRPSRRSARTKSDTKTKAAAGKTEEKSAAPEPPAKIARPHFVLKDQVLKAPEPEPVAVKPVAKPEPPKPEPKSVAASKPSPPEPEDQDSEDMVEINGRQVRLDGPEDSLRGLSKRERRKLRKEMKDRERADF